MKATAPALAKKNHDGHIKFLEKFLEDGRPPNLIIVIDTHSDTWSGQLQTARGRTVDLHRKLPDLVQEYVGQPVLDVMKTSSRQARSYDVLHEISGGVAPWADITPKSRGGWRVLIMPVCGSTMTQPVHWSYLVHMFKE